MSKKEPFIVYIVVGTNVMPGNKEDSAVKIECYLTFVFATGEKEALAILLAETTSELAGKSILLTKASPFVRFVKDKRQVNMLIEALTRL